LNAPEALKGDQRMKKIMLVIAYVGIAAGFAPAVDQSFQKTKIPDAKGNQTPVGLVFGDSKQTIQVRSAGQTIAEMDKSEYKDILAAAQVQTGKDVTGKKENSNVEFQKH
jgi:hypothetical protein